MTWEVFYDKYVDWSKNTILKHIDSLHDMGEPDEVAEVISYISEPARTKLMRRALNMGVVFSPSDIMDLDRIVSKELLTEAFLQIRTDVSREDLEDLEGIVDQKVLLAKDKKQNTHAFDNDEKEEKWVEEETDVYDDYTSGGDGKPHRLNGLIGGWILSSWLDKKSKNKGKDKPRS